MSNQLTIGFVTEGPTDVRFLASIIQRTFEDVAFECDSEIEILPLQHLSKENGEFIGVVKTYAKKAYEQGLMVLCVHTDADDSTDTHTFRYKINPALDAVEELDEPGFCKNIVAIVPVRMSEAWMLSDTELLRNEIGTSNSDQELKIDRKPEAYADPKAAIEEAIRIARQNLTKRRRRELTIGELYLPIGQKIALHELEKQPSYQKFRKAVQEAFRKLNYLH